MKKWICFPSRATNVHQGEATLTDFCEHFKQVWQSPLLLLKDVFHIGFLLLLLCWGVNRETLEVVHIADDLT